MIKFIKSLFGFPPLKPYVLPKYNARKISYVKEKFPQETNITSWPHEQEDRHRATYDYSGSTMIHPHCSSSLDTGSSSCDSSSSSDSGGSSSGD